HCRCRLSCRVRHRIFLACPRSCAVIRLPDPKPAILAKRDAVIAALRTLVPGDGVISEAIRLRPYETDGLSAYRQPPLAVVLPRTTQEVAAVLRYCHQEGIRVIPRGAGTSL